MIHATHRHVVLMLCATMEYVHVYRNITVIHIQDVALNVF